MIRINLLKKPQKKQLLQWKLTTKQLLPIGYITGALIVCTLCLVLIKRLYFTPKTTATAIIMEENFKPSTFVEPEVVEEVVRDVNDEQDKINQHGFLNLPYEQLSFIEKINYEIHFAKNICDLLYRTFPEGVDFRTLKINSFNTFKGEGLSDSKENVKKVFTELKNQRVELLPKPHTVIQQKNGVFYFTITCLTEFGLNLEAPFLLGQDDVLEYRDLPLITDKITEIAKENNITMTSDLTRSGANSVGDYKRVRYRFSGTASYTSFVSFINNLYDRQIPCAFETITVTAIAKDSLSITAEILFTTSN